MEKIFRLLQEQITGTVKMGEELSHHTSFRIGGPADLFVEPETVGELSVVVSVLRRERLSCFLLGSGTNLLVGDAGFRGVVIRLGRQFRQFHYEGSILVSGSAVPLAVLAKDACRQGFTNLEFATGIPGSLGGALFMNAGAHGNSVGQFVLEATALDREGSIHTLSPQELGFSYRGSRIKPGAIICSARLSLKPGVADEIEDKCRRYSEFRTTRQPRLPNAGSIFKNPPGDAAGRLLEAAGLKGLRVGGAMISEQHANFIVNCGGATARDVLALIDVARQAVREKSGVDLELEIKVFGE